MVLCHLCGEEFRTAQGLAGHKRHKHDGDMPATVPMDRSRGEVPVTHQDLQDLEDFLGQMLIELHGELAELRELVGSQPTMNQPRHGLCFEKGCELCQPAVASVFQQGREHMDAEHRGIPGVEKALEDWKLMNTPIGELP